MVKENCAVRVTSYLHCARHGFDYHHWNWETTDLGVIEDQGFLTAPLPSISGSSTPRMGASRAPGQRQQSLMQLDQEASREASLEIFRWFVING